MIQQLNSRDKDDRSMRASQTIHILPYLNLDHLIQILRYALISIVAIAYLVISIFCLIEDHPMSKYLIMPIAIVLLLVIIHISFKSKTA